MPSFANRFHRQSRSKSHGPLRIIKHSRGQSLVELALTLPLLLLILLGVIDLGRIYFSYITVVNAAREGARYGAGHPQDLNTARTRAINESLGSGITLTSVTVTCPSGCAMGNPVRAVVSYNFQLITLYIFGGGTIPLQATVDMEIFSS